MRHPAPFLAAALCGLGLALAACPAVGAGTPPTVPPLPAWAQVPEQTLPADQAQAISDVTHKFFALLHARDLSAAHALCSPLTADDDWILEVVAGFASPSAYVSLTKPQLASPEVARVYALAQSSVTPDGQERGWSSGEHYLYFLLSDPQHLIRVLAGGEAPDELDLPSSTVDDFDPVMASFDPAADPDWQQHRRELLGLFSPQWPGWSQNGEETLRHIQAWWQAQGNMLVFFAAEPPSVPRFVGMNGASAIVERIGPVYSDQWDEIPTTYRFRLVQDPTIQDPPELKRHHKWRIADICVYRTGKAVPQPES